MSCLESDTQGQYFNACEINFSYFKLFVMLWYSVKLHINTQNTGMCGLQAALCITQNPGDAGTSIPSFRPRFTQLHWENFDKKKRKSEILSVEIQQSFICSQFTKKKKTLKVKHWRMDVINMLSWWRRLKTRRCGDHLGNHLHKPEGLWLRR